MRESEYFARGLRLAEHGFRRYEDYLRSPAWARVRARYYADPHTPKACICGADRDLLLHHLGPDAKGVACIKVKLDQIQAKLDETGTPARLSVPH